MFSAIEAHSIIFRILSHDSTLVRSIVGAVSVATLIIDFVDIMAEIEHVNVSNEEFMEEVARYECVYHRNSKDFKDKNKKAKVGTKSGRSLIYRPGKRRPNFAT